jgi:Tol biopolymer transport system component
VREADRASPLGAVEEGVDIMTEATNSTGLERGRSPGRSDLQPGQVSQLIAVDIEDGSQRLVLQTDRLIESPNWTPDGEWLIVNGQGRLYRARADGSGDLEQIPVGAVSGVNNDHVLSPDGKRIYFSATGHLYCVPIEGGDARRVSNLHPEEQQYSYWLHGVSPDEQTLVYTSVEPEGDQPRGRRNLATIPAAGGLDHQITEGVNAYDGPEYSPDGEWIYYNSEEAAARPGHAQIFRMSVDEQRRERLTFDDRVNWLPHVSPDGKWCVYISYEEGTITHPADLDVELRLIPADGGEPRTVAALFGGQGTLNTNGWAPDSRRFAFVAYPSTR